MGEGLKKFIANSCRSYISSLDETGKIMSRVTALTSAEIDPADNFSILQNLIVTLDIVNQDSKHASEVSLGKNLVHLYNLLHNPFDKGKDKLDCVRICLMNLMQALKYNKSRNVYTELFLLVTVKAFFGHIALKTGWSDSDVLNRFISFRTKVRRTTGCCISDTTTMGELFNEIEKQINSRWDITTPIEDYGKRIIGCYNILCDLFIEEFSRGYNEYYRTA